jgi:hypothetical protein
MCGFLAWTDFMVQSQIWWQVGFLGEKGGGPSNPPHRKIQRFSSPHELGGQAQSPALLQNGGFRIDESRRPPPNELLQIGDFQRKSPTLGLPNPIP